MTSTELDVIVIDLPAPREPSPTLDREHADLDHFRQLVAGLRITAVRLAEQRDQARDERDRICGDLHATRHGRDAVAKELRAAKVALAAARNRITALEGERDQALARARELERDYKPRAGRRHRNTGQTES